MPSLWHDAANQLFRDHAWLAPRIVRECVNVDLPAGLPATVGSPHFNDRKSRDFYADTVVVVGGRPADPAYGVIVEPQQRQDQSKLDDWPRYAAGFWLETGRPAWVLVLCPSQKVADWYLDRQPTLRNILEELVASDILLSSPIAKENFAKGKAEGKTEGIAEGKTEGEAEAVLLVLEARGLIATAEERSRISGCNDLGQLRAWLTRAVKVSTVAELFA